ncbi:MAG: T9SS type A sorting domain-containing protein [Saprospiraceae bacterium]|nr:T9SS type A sorting domain-containing protein [Saprospiraceae bacterium]
MNKFNLISALLLSSASCLWAQSAPAFDWVKPVFGATPTSPLQAAITDLETDPFGNTYITGEFVGQLNFGSGVSLSGNGSDPTLFLAKYGYDGTPLWAKKGSPASPADANTFHHASKIATDGAGGVYWCGDYVSNSVDFGNNVIVTRSCANACQEGFLLKFDPSGNLVFQKNIRAKLGEQLHLAGVAADSLGRHYLTGSYTGTELWLQGGGNIGGLTTQGFFLAAYYPNGNSNWIGFPADNTLVPTTQAIEVSPDGERIAMSGHHGAGMINFGNGAIVNSAATENRFVLVYTAAGQPSYIHSVNSDPFVEIFDIAVGPAYNVFAACTFSGTLKDKSGNTLHTSSSERTSALLLMSPDGSTGVGNIIPHTTAALPANTLTLGPPNSLFMGGLSGEQLSVPNLGSLNNNGCLDAVIVGNGGGLPSPIFGNVGGSGCERIDNIYFGSMMAPDGEGNMIVGGVFENGGSFGSENYNGNGLWLAKMYTGVVATDEPGLFGGISIRPNPSGGLVQIAFPDDTFGQCRIYAATGKMMMDAAIQSNLSLQVENWPSGLYLVECQDRQGKIFREKLMVQH